MMIKETSKTNGEFTFWYKMHDGKIQWNLITTETLAFTEKIYEKMKINIYIHTHTHLYGKKQSLHTWKP